MTRYLNIIASVGVLAALAACAEPAKAPAEGQMAPSPAGPPFITTMDPNVSNAAVSSCEAALDAQTDGAVSVAGSETSEAATAIYMRVGANGAPWRCLVAADGSNPELMFMGSEGSN